MSEHTLEEMRRKIVTYRGTVGKAPFSHNIICLILADIAKRFGDDEANKAIRELRLERLGWKVKE